MREYYLSDGRRIEIGDGENPLENDPLLQQAVRIGILCNEASFRAEATDENRTIGDPTETALLVVADALILDVSHERAIHPKIAEQPFHASTKRMTTLHRKTDGQHFAALKGAPAVVLDACSNYRDAAGNTVPAIDWAVIASCGLMAIGIVEVTKFGFRWRRAAPSIDH